MEEGTSGVDQPEGKVRDLKGGGKTTAGGAPGDPLHHLRSQMGGGQVGGDEGFDPCHEEAVAVPAPLPEEPLEGPDPETGGKVAVGPVPGEGGKEEEDGGPGSKPGSKMIEEKDQGRNGGKGESGISTEGGMGEEGKAQERLPSEGVVYLRKRLLRGLEIPREKADGGEVGRGLAVRGDKNLFPALRKPFGQLPAGLPAGAHKEMGGHQGIATDDQSLG